VPGHPSEYLPAFKENRLKGEEIKGLLFGSTIAGIFADGQQWWIDQGKDDGFRGAVKGQFLFVRPRMNW
jgi:hypothetical protein